MFVVLCMCSWEMVAVFVALFVFEITILLIYWCMVSTVFESCMGCFFFSLFIIYPSISYAFLYIYMFLSQLWSLEGPLQKVSSGCSSFLTWKNNFQWSLAANYSPGGCPFHLSRSEYPMLVGDSWGFR